MNSFIRSLKGEFQKIKRGGVLLLHIFLSLLVIMGIIFLTERSIYNDFGRLAIFIEFFALGVPFAVALAVNLVLKVEYNAGRYKGILKSESGRICSIIGKLLMLIIIGTVTFGGVMSLFFLWEIYFRNSTINMVSYYKILGVFGSCITAQYIMAIIITLKWGQTGGVILGGIGSLTGALMVTGLGDKIWRYIPFGWIPRMQNGILLNQNMRDDFTMIGIITAALLAYLLFWIERWEGCRNLE